MYEKRENTRVNPPEGSLAVNQLSQARIGRLIDISASGFLLAGRVGMNPGMIFQLELVLTADPEIYIKVGAECIWSDLQTSGLTFGGFQIIDISDADQTTLNDFIEQLAVH